MQKMAASRLSATAASCSAPPNRIYADSPFRFSPFSSSTPSAKAQAQAQAQAQVPRTDSSRLDFQPAVEDSRAGFDPRSLERGAKLSEKLIAHLMPNRSLLFSEAMVITNDQTNDGFLC